MDHYTFDMLPSLMGRAVELLEEISRKVENVSRVPNRDDLFPEMMNLETLCEYLPSQPAKSTVYEWVSDNYIPHYHEGKKLTFCKSEIKQWQLSHRTASDEEIQQKADELIVGLRKNCRWK